MTEPIFRTDAYAAHCTSEVLESGEGGVVLDRTVFYPQGGGQPGDSGRLVWEGGEAAVEVALKGEGDAVLHRLAPGATAPGIGARVTAELDWDRRHRHMRVHTALHLLSVAIPLPVTGGQISAEKGRLDFDMPDAPEDRDAIEARLTTLIAEDHGVTEEWITDEELAANPGLVKTMSVKPPVGAGRVRLIRIGEGAGTVDLQPCGGTHVRRTGEIGALTLGKIEKKGRQNRRVSILLG